MDELKERGMWFCMCRYGWRSDLSSGNLTGSIGLVIGNEKEAVWAVW